MKKWFSLTGCAGLLAITSACTPAAAPDTREADVRAVKDVEAAWAKDAATKDVERWVSYYSDDASVLFPNSPAMTGKDALRGAMKPMLADPNFALTFQSTRAEASKGGDLVYSVGTYTMTLSDKDNKPITDKGKYLTVFKKQPDGSWKAVADMINTDLPMQPPAK